MPAKGSETRTSFVRHPNNPGRVIPPKAPPAPNLGSFWTTCSREKWIETLKERAKLGWGPHGHTPIASLTQGPNEPRKWGVTKSPDFAPKPSYPHGDEHGTD